MILYGPPNDELRSISQLAPQLEIQVAVGGKALVELGVPLKRFSEVRGMWVQVPGNGLVYAASNPPREEELKAIMREVVRLSGE